MQTVKHTGEHMKASANLPALCQLSSVFSSLHAWAWMQAVWCSGKHAEERAADQRDGSQSMRRMQRRASSGPAWQRPPDEAIMPCWLRLC